MLVTYPLNHFCRIYSTSNFRFSQKTKKSNLFQYKHASKGKLKKLGNAFINANEESIQEGIYKTVPDFQLTFCHPEVIFVPASMPTERVGILKRPQDLNLLEDGSEDIFQKSLIDRYKERPDDKRDMCLADFCAWYKPLYGRPSAKAEIISLKNDTGRMVKRLSKVIVRSHIILHLEKQILKSIIIISYACISHGS